MAAACAHHVDAQEEKAPERDPAGLTEIRVIHGVGTGRLRAYLLACLKDDSRVADTRQADLRAGGFGVSVVRLVDDS